MTRDEISVRRASGHLDCLDGRLFDIDQAKRYINNLKNKIDRLREPTLDRNVIMQTMWKLPIDQVLSRFATIDRNVMILGDKRLTFLYAKHSIANYTTGLGTANYRWDDMIDFLEVALKLHATIGAYIEVHHHQRGYLGSVKKLKTANAFWVPIGLRI